MLRGGAVMGSQDCGAGWVRVEETLVRGGNGENIFTPCHSLIARVQGYRPTYVSEIRKSSIHIKFISVTILTFNSRIVKFYI